jgi:hypothetical protein
VITSLNAPARRITARPVAGKDRLLVYCADLVARKPNGSERLVPVRIKVTSDLTHSLPDGLLLLGMRSGAIAIGNAEPTTWGKTRGSIFELLRLHLGWTDDNVEFVLPNIVA